MSKKENFCIGILEPNEFSEEVIEQLKQLGSVIQFNGMNQQVFLRNVNALFVRLGHRIDAKFLEDCPNLKYLCSPTTGHNHIDEGELKQRGIELISLRGEREFLETIRATPEHTFGLIMALLRNYKSALTHVDDGRWDRDQLRGEELYGQTVGIIGLGRVGYRLAEYCEAFGANVVYCDQEAVPANTKWKNLQTIEAVIKASLIVVLTASYEKGMPHIIGFKEIALLKGRYFINTARGELVDESALLSAISNNFLKGFATDVIASETESNNLAYWRELATERSNCIITPHIAGATRGSMARTESYIAARLLSHLSQTEKKI